MPNACPIQKIRRIVRVELTGQGNETFQTIRTFMLGRVEQAMSPLSPSERETFICLLNKVLDAFE